MIYVVPFVHVGATSSAGCHGVATHSVEGGEGRLRVMDAVLYISQKERQVIYREYYTHCGKMHRWDGRRTN